MKKFLLVLLGVFVLVGCKKMDENVISDMENIIESLENYHLIGDLQILNNQDKYNYDVDVTYKKGDYYRVSLINKENSHEQIILKNDEGVYVVTPSLNKSFKFQSQWPTNSSQSYILSTIVNDIKNDEERTVTTKDDNYEISTKVNYPNNTDLKNMIVTLGKDKLPKSVVVKNSSGNDSIILKITKIDTKAKYDKSYFALSSNIKEEVKDKTESTKKDEKAASNILDDIVYPMYLPVGTQYYEEEIVNAPGSDRVILTYTGEKPFILIEQVASTSEEHETQEVSGEIVMYKNVLGALSETSFNWSDSDREYYLIGDSLSKSELLQIASSTASVAITK